MITKKEALDQIKAYVAAQEEEVVQFLKDFIAIDSTTYNEGKAVEWDAAANKDLLTTIITMDEGSAYLGECALVPYDSPIQNSGILFYNTLFDENAACHLALGRGFNDCIEGFENKTNDECKAMGINDSMEHEDFMIGSKDLNIVATTRDGKKVQIFKDGNWAF